LRAGRAALLAACLTAAAACSSGPAALDAAVAGPDVAAAQLPTCQLAPGRSWIFDGFNFLGPADAYDYGDGVKRNSLAALANPVVKSAIDRAVQNGNVRFAIHIVGFEGGEPPAMLRPDAVEAMQLIGSGDAPPDAAPAFCADPQQFNVDCSSWSHADTSMVSDDLIHAFASDWSIVAGSFGVGTIEFHDIVLDIQKKPSMVGANDGKTWDAVEMTLHGIWSACSLASTLGINSPTLLDSVTGRQLAPSVIQPDFDLSTNRGIDTSDGGVEVFGNVDGITTCLIEGQVMTGARCACDPRIPYGYSVALRFEGVSAAVQDLCDE
jgi:hypothetical protein